MMSRQRRRSVLLTAGIAAALLVPGVLACSAAKADTSAPSLLTGVNASDPFATPCTDSATGFQGICLYTSRDLGSGAYAGNDYPMNATYLYTLADGKDPSVPGNWQARGSNGVVLNESQYSSWVPSGAKHLWAPTMVSPSAGKYYLLVPDVTSTANSGNPSLHTSSKIGVSDAASPFGPFTYRKTLSLKGYASDPSVLVDGTAGLRLVYADGDYDNCGTVSTAKLDANLDVVSGSQQKVQITGLPSTFNGCGGSRPYLEGPELYRLTAPNGTAEYYLVFAAKLNNQNEVIAYARSKSATGPFEYAGGRGGIIMNGSSTEWTNQASIVARSGGKFLFFYHDGPSGTHNRKVHAECLTMKSDGSFPTINRSSNNNALKTCG